ncbi:MAG: T9SS type A sorting domain-containing protein [Bacteroidetes bacterium]|nr:T9SS type A sorting domain-containing protein [Bacteroidota bacterium]
MIRQRLTHNNTFDSNSTSKSPEPEALAIGHIGDSVYAYIGLERIGGIMVYNITNANAPMFIQYINNRDFAQTSGSGTVNSIGDLGPEGLTFIPMQNSPNGRNLVVVANEISGTVSIYQTISGTTSASIDAVVPTEFSLMQNFPNRFNPSTIISFSLPSERLVSVVVYNLIGQEVRTLVNEKRTAGKYTISFDASSLSSGMYFYSLRSGSYVDTKKMTLLK